MQACYNHVAGKLLFEFEKGLEILLDLKFHFGI